MSKVLDSHEDERTRTRGFAVPFEAFLKLHMPGVLASIRVLFVVVCCCCCCFNSRVSETSRYIANIGVAAGAFAMPPWGQM